MKTQDKPKTWTSFRGSVWWEYIQVFAVAFVLVFGFMRPFVVEAFKIPSASMENTLLIGDRILVAKFIYGIKIPFTDKQILNFHEPEIGDIFVFKPPPEADRTQNFIKRIVGLEGDVITVKNGKLYRNGISVPDENYVKRWAFRIDPIFRSELDSKNISDSLRQIFIKRQSALSDNATVSVQDKGGRWKIADEEALLFALRLKYQRDLENGNISEDLRQKFKSYGISLSQDAAASVEEEGNRWLITDNEEKYYIKKENSKLNIHGKETYLIRRDKRDYEPDIYNVYVGEGAYSRRTPSRRGGLQNRPPFTVPPGHVFAMGDNRDMSNDSRAWGPVPIENIKGQAFLKYWSWDSGADWLHKIRYSRIGSVVR